MRKVIIIGASGSLASYVIDAIKSADLTLFVREKSRLAPHVTKDRKVIEGDAMDYESVKNAIMGHDIVYVNLAGDLENMVKNIVAAMASPKQARLFQERALLRLLRVLLTIPSCIKMKISA